jgi:hypothetical protein
MRGLLNFRKNVFSQFGEDGIIEEILKRTDLIKKEIQCCEFGAWDGMHLSNTFNLVKNFSAKAVYIEGDPNKFLDLMKTSKQYPNITPIKKFVGLGKEELLDNILKKTFLKKDFEILSIDIDGYDLDIWDTFIHYQPKIVIIEINSSLLPGILWRHNEQMSGNSFTSTILVGEKKKYTPICHTGNIFFIRNDLLNKLNLAQDLIKFPEKLFITNWIKKEKEKSFKEKIIKKIKNIFFNSNK